MTRAGGLFLNLLGLGKRRAMRRRTARGLIARKRAHDLRWGEVVCRSVTKP